MKKILVSIFAISSMAWTVKEGTQNLTGKCVTKMHIQEGIYVFGFMNESASHVYSPKSLKDGLFKDFGYTTVSKVLPYSSRKNEWIENEHFILVELNPRTDSNKDFFSPNRFEFLPRFMAEDSVHYVLSYAEINTSAERIYSKYPITNEEIFAKLLKFNVAMTNGSITVGNSKSEVKKALGIASEKCISDTLKISDDTEDSYYFFNNDTLYKIVFNFYNG
jgi:hypothetical protein